MYYAMIILSLMSFKLHWIIQKFELLMNTKLQLQFILPATFFFLIAWAFFRTYEKLTINFSHFMPWILLDAKIRLDEKWNYINNLVSLAPLKFSYTMSILMRITLLVSKILDGTFFCLLPLRKSFCWVIQQHTHMRTRDFNGNDKVFK